MATTKDALDIPSPRPWRIEGQTIRDREGGVVVSALNPANMATRRLIVEAVTGRDRLRKALEDISEFAAGMTSDEDEANALEILDICAKALEGME